MSIPELIEEVAAKGAFEGYEVEPWTPENFYAGIQAESDAYSVKVHMIGLRTSNPGLGFIMMFSEGLNALCGKEMMSVLPTAHDKTDPRGIECAPEIGKNILIHMINGMVERDMKAPNPVQAGIAWFMINAFIETDDEGPVQAKDGTLSLTDGGKMIAANLGEAAFWGWTEVQEPVCHDA